MEEVIFDLECEGLIRISPVEQRSGAAHRKSQRNSSLKDLHTVLQNRNNVFLSRCT